MLAEDCLHFNGNETPCCIHPLGQLIAATPEKCNQKCKYYEGYQNCQRCPDLVKSRSQVVWGAGNHTTDIIFVGESPGRLGADKTGVPFKGDNSGKIFEKLLEHLGLKRSQTYITNLVKCCPEKGRAPAPGEIKNCVSWLHQELRNIRPRIIVTVGATATAHFMPISHLGTWVYKPVGISQGRIIVPIYHPAYVSRNGWDLTTYFRVIKQAIEKARKWKR